MQNILLLGSCEGAGAEDIEQMIRIENVSKWYGDFQVLKNCSTSVKKGEVVVICGPSGSGKSTLIKTVNGLEDYQEGTIYVNNINIERTLEEVEEVLENRDKYVDYLNLAAIKLEHKARLNEKYLESLL